MRELLDGRVVCALADNDGAGRRLWKNSVLHKGGVWMEQTNGVNWCLLRPTDEFEEVMQAHRVPMACWPFTVEGEGRTGRTCSGRLGCGARIPGPG